MFWKKKHNRKEAAHSILVLSPEGKALKSIRFSMIFPLLVVAIVLLGIVALFIPSDFFRISDDEGFKKLHLFEQNRLLQERITAISSIVKSCNEHITVLDRKKERVANLLGSRKTGQVVPQKPSRSFADRLQNDPDRVAGEIGRWEAVLTEFMSGMKNGSLFDSVPVCKPVEGNAVLTRPFGKCHDPFTGMEKWHYGIDYAGPVGTKVLATAAGQIERVENDTEWGKRVTIRHGRGLSTKYAHLGTVAVNRGKRVARGEMIGTLGNSGLVTGPHLHYELWQNGKPVDPERLFFPLADAELASR